MTVAEHASQWAGKPVALFDAGAPFDFRANVPRIAIDWDSHVDGLGIDDVMREVFRRPDAGELSGLVFGVWDFIGAVSSSVIVDALMKQGPSKLPKLDALFFGDILDSEQEMAWIAQSDLGPIFDAFPRLREMRIRGSAGLSLGTSGRLAHAKLESLAIESAGLDRAIVQTVATSDFPALKHLELWLGATSHGGNVTLDDLAPIFVGDRFPALETLAIKNAETADSVAAAVAASPIVSRLQKLDLSLGTLSDEGAEALLASPSVAQLRDLDLRQSYLSPEMTKRFHAFHPVIVDIRGSRYGKDEKRRPSTVPPKRSFELPLAQMRRRKRA